MERQVRKAFSRMRRFVLNEPHVKKSQTASADSRPVRINLPPELGGGFTMVTCPMTATIGSFTSQVIGMCQATNTRLLDAREWGLSQPLDIDDIDDETADTASIPRVFLHPDTAIALIVKEQGQNPELDLLRVRPAKDRVATPQLAPQSEEGEYSQLRTTGNQSSRPGHVRVWSTANGSLHVAADSKEDEELIVDDVDSRFHRVFVVQVNKGDRRWTRDPEVTPSPFDKPTNANSLTQQQTHMRHSILTQLKRVKPPKGSLPPPLTCLLIPEPITVSNGGRPSPGISALQPPSQSQSHLSVPATPNTKPSPITRSPSGSQLGAKIPLNKADAKALKEREKERATELSTIDSVLTALSSRGIGPIKQKKSADKRKKASADSNDDDDDSDTMDRAKSEWCGGEIEIPMLFTPTRSANPANKKAKLDVSENCFVLTNLRAVQLENGRVVSEMKIGPGSGINIDKPKRSAITPAPAAIAAPTSVSANGQPQPQSLALYQLQFRVRALQADTTSFNSDDDDTNSDVSIANNSGDDEDEPQPRRPSTATVTFSLPSSECCSYVQSFVLYMQEKLLLEQTLYAALSASTAPSSQSLIGAGWTSLLKSFIGPLVFGHLRLPIYTHQIKQVLARVQQMNLKNVTITSLKLIQFYLPSPELTEDGDEMNEDFIPSLSLRSYQGHPVHEYLFDIHWNCSAFLVRVGIEGKKLMNFKLEIEMKGIQVSGSVILKSSPYAPEKLAISFLSLPQISFGIGSHVIVGSVKLPFQRSIERLLTQQIQLVLAQQLEAKVVFPKFVSVYFPQSQVSLLLNRWWSVAKFPFTLDGRDDEEMIGLALVIGTQAEQALQETLKGMRERREELEDYMMRPLYNEDQSREWKQKEAKRMDERKKQRESDDREREGESKYRQKKSSKANNTRTVSDEVHHSSNEQSPSVSVAATPQAKKSRRTLSITVDDEESKTSISTTAVTKEKKKKERSRA